MEKKYTIKSELTEISKIYDGIKESLDSHLPSKHLNKVLLVVQEIVTDAVIHGNQSDPQKEVTCFLQMQLHEIHITISDEGDGDYLLPTKEEASELDYLEESGRGLKLAVLLSDQIIKEDSSLQLIFKKEQE